MIVATYMQRVAAQTDTRFWINNPTGAELAASVAEGAISGTTNPTYASNLIRREPDYALPIVDDIIREVKDDMEAADLIYQRLTARFMEGFLPRYEQSGGTEGLVTMQDDPCRDHEAGLILAAAERHAKVGANYMAKIPVIPTGMEAMADLIRRNMPICATECFSIAQAVAMCDLYERIADECGHTPPFYITHITGIYDEELQDYVQRENVVIDPGILHQAGSIVGRKQYAVLKQRGYRTTMLGGGARGTHHFTEFVGGDVHITMNWSTIRELNELDGDVVERIGAEAPTEIVEELSDKIPDFRRAYEDEGLKPEEFEHFAPLLRFRKNFTDGCEDVLRVIEARRKTMGAAR